MPTLKRKKECLLIYALFIAICKPYFLQTIVQQIIKLIFICIILLFIFTRTKKNEYFNISLIFGGSVIVSSFFANRMNYISNMSFFNAIYFAVCFYCIYSLIGYFAKRNRSKECLIYLLDIVFLYCVASIITYFVPLYVDGSGLVVYAFGNKSGYRWLLQ